MPSFFGIDFRWWIFLHIVGVVGFLLAHGVSTAVYFRLRKERDRARIKELIQFSGSAATALYVFLLVLLIGGIGAGFALSRWGHWWIWASLILLVGITGVMLSMARPYYRGVTEAVELRPSGVPRRSDEELDALLDSRRPMISAYLGFATLLVIVWLMVFKPG